MVGPRWKALLFRLWSSFGPTTTLGLLALVMLVVGAYFTIRKRDRRTGTEWLLLSWFVVFADMLVIVVNSFAIIGDPPDTPLEWTARLFWTGFGAVARSVVPAILSLPVIWFLLDKKTIGDVRPLRLPIIACAIVGIDVILLLLNLHVLIPA